MIMAHSIEELLQEKIRQSYAIIYSLFGVVLSAVYGLLLYADFNSNQVAKTVFAFYFPPSFEVLGFGVWKILFGAVTVCVYLLSLYLFYNFFDNLVSSLQGVRRIHYNNILKKYAIGFAWRLIPLSAAFYLPYQQSAFHVAIYIFMITSCIVLSFPGLLVLELYGPLKIRWRNER
jgi:hypothetical protein